MAHSRTHSYSGGTRGEADEDSVMINEALDFARHADAPPPPAYTPRLEKPVAVPQISPKMGSPFARVYSPILTSYNIRPLEFVEFLDNFNILLTGSPPLAVMNMVGQGLGFVPNHWAQLAGSLTQLAVGVATYAVIKTRCAMFVKKSNAEFFEPRGLKVQIKSTEEMAKICRVRLNEVMVEPLRVGEDVSAVGPLDRRLQAVQEYVAPLSFNVPAPTEQTTILAKMSQKQSEATRRKMEKKTLKDRQKALEKLPGGAGMKSEREMNKELAKLNKEVYKVEAKAKKEMEKATKKRKADKQDEEVEKAERERNKELAKIEKEREKVFRKAAKESEKEQKDYQKDDKEIKESKKGLWIMVRNLDEVQADEEEEARQKANSPLAFLSSSRPN